VRTKQQSNGSERLSLQTLTRRGSGKGGCSLRLEWTAAADGLAGLRTGGAVARGSLGRHRRCSGLHSGRLAHCPARNPAAFAHAAHLEKRLAEGADVPPNPPPAASNPPTRSRLAQLSPGSSLGAGAALPRLQRVVDGQLALEDTRRVRATPAERPGGETYGRGAPPEFASAAAGTTSERRLCSQNRAARAIQGNQRCAAPAPAGSGESWSMKRGPRLRGASGSSSWRS